VNQAEPVVQAFLDDVLADDPVLATALGLTEGAGRLPSWSAEALAGRACMVRGHEQRLLPLVQSTDVDTAVDAFAGLQIAHRLLRPITLCRCQHVSPGTYLDVLYGLLPLLMRELGTSAARVDALDGRLRATPALLDEARDNLEHGLPAVAVQVAVDQAQGMLELAGPTVRAFAAQVGRPGALDESSAAACEALTGFLDYLRDDLLPGASPQCGAGREVLADILRWEHVLGETPEELAAYGREVLAETIARMAELTASLGYPDVATAVAAACDQHPAADGLVAAYERAVHEARDYVVTHDIVSLPPGEELQVTATPGFLRSALPFAAYDAPGPYLERQLGFYWVTPPREGLTGGELDSALRNHPTASLANTGVHEAYPGHHVQLTAANRASTLARRIAGIPEGGNILVEGWAFYCEELMEQQGFLAGLHTRLMRLNDQAWRACRVVIDVELHLGVMDLAAAVDFLASVTHMNRDDAELECRRYAVEPGQAMSYLLGKREVQRLAAQHHERHAASLREFHDELLSWGSLPPAVIAWGMGLAPAPAAALSS